MKEAHQSMKEKYEEEINTIMENHASEFCSYEDNIRFTMDKKVILLFV